MAVEEEVPGAMVVNLEAVASAAHPPEGTAEVTEALVATEALEVEDYLVDLEELAEVAPEATEILVEEEVRSEAAGVDFGSVGTVAPLVLVVTGAGAEVLFQAERAD